MKRPSRPPGPPPLVLELRLAGVDQVVTLTFDAESEPVICRRIGELADAGAYDGAALRSKAWWLQLELPADATRALGRTAVEPRRIRHSKFDAGSIGWSWEKVPSDGRGEFFITRTRQDALDSAYQQIGAVVGGLGALLALPIIPAAQLRGRARIEPAVVETIRPVRLDVAQAG